MTEWRSISGFPGYEVSDDGQVRSVERTIERHSRRGLLYSQQVPARTLRQYEHTRGGRIVGLRVSLWVGGKGRTKDVHDLVLTAFVGPRPAGSLGLHWNDIPTDNRLETLRWGTKRDNSLDALRNGKNRPPISRRGIEHYEARLSFEQVTLIRELVAAGKAKKALARQFGVTDKTIANYARGKVRVAA